MSTINFYEKINFALWRKVHTLPRFFIEQWQVIHLRRIVQAAYANVAVYQNSWDNAGIKPNDIHNISDISRLPLINKNTLRSFIEKNGVRNSLAYRHHTWKQTSGSTGEPFKFPFSHPAFSTKNLLRCQLSTHYTFRPLERRKVDINNIRVVLFRVNHLPPIKNPMAIYIPEIREESLRVLTKIREFQPVAVWGTPTIFTELAHRALTLPKEKRPLIPFTISSSEKLSTQQRKFIESVFHTEIYDCYGMEEVQNIAIECEFHRGLHVYEESFIIEILDEQDKVLNAGIPGRIVITSFYNDIFPFIRYETEDWGTILPGNCSCGLSTKRLILEGRISGFFSFNKKNYHYFELEKILLKYTESILRYQFVKTAEDGAELRIIPYRQFHKAETENLCDDYKKLCGIQIKLKIVDTLPISPRGKTSVFVDESKKA